MSADFSNFSFSNSNFQTRNAEKMELEELNATLTEENELLREKAMKVNDLESIIAELVSDADDVAQESE